jgi:hypothetical protein
MHTMDSMVHEGPNDNLHGVCINYRRLSDQTADNAVRVIGV